MTFDVYKAWDAACDYVAQSHHATMELEVYVDAYNNIPAAVACYGRAQIIDCGHLQKVRIGNVLVYERREE